MRYVKGKLTKTADNEWVFITRFNRKDKHSEISGVHSYPITALDEEIVLFHVEDLRATHSIEYRGESIRAELQEQWSTPEGGYSELYPSEAFLKFANKKTFAKLIYQQDEEITDTTTSDSADADSGRAE
jgi:hypothetical protein